MQLPDTLKTDPTDEIAVARHVAAMSGAAAPRPVDGLAAPHIAIVTSAPFLAFHNGLRALFNLDAMALVEAGVIDDRVEYRRFADDPVRWFMRADDRRAAAVWSLIQERQPAALKDGGIGGTGAVSLERMEAA